MHDLYAAMVHLIKVIMGSYLPIRMIKDHLGSELPSIPHDNRALQLSDADLFICTEARTILTSLEDTGHQKEVKLFYR